MIRVATCAVIIVIACILYRMDEWAACLGTPKDAMRNIFQKHQAFLLEAALRSEEEYISGKTNGFEVKWSAFSSVRIRVYRYNNGDVSFTFPWSYSMPEGSIHLEYIPDDTFDAWYLETMSLVSHQDDTWRWEGGGISGNGYCTVERFAPNWFYVETYLPT